MQHAQTIHERIEPILAPDGFVMWPFSSCVTTSRIVFWGDDDKTADPLLAYERTPEFRFYLLAKVEWEQTKESYLRGPRTAAAVKTELRAWEYAQTLLELARRTPEHLAAFGY